MSLGAHLGWKADENLSLDSGEAEATHPEGANLKHVIMITY